MTALPPPRFDPALSLDQIPTGQDIRSRRPEEYLRNLGYSLKDGQLQPIGISIADSVVVQIWGFSRVAAARMVGLTTLAAMVYPKLTSEQTVIAAIVENLQRAEMSQQDTTRACKQLEDGGMARNAIGEGIRKSASSITQYLAVYSCPPQTQEAFWADQLTHNQCYKISLSPDPLATMTLFLNGGTRGQAERAARRSKGTPRGETASRVQIPLAVDTDTLTAHGKVTVASLPGKELDLDGVDDLLNAALRAVRDAKKRGISARSFSSAMKDIAAAAG